MFTKHHRYARTVYKPKTVSAITNTGRLGIHKIRKIWISWQAHTKAGLSLFTSLCLCSGCVFLASSAFAAETTPGVGSGSVLKALLALTLVLVAVFGIAWIARRFSPAPAGGTWLKLRGGLAVGTRERVVLVEVKDTWLVVGVAPGQVNVLHTLPRPEEVLSENGNSNASRNFAAWLGNAIKRQTHA